MTPIVSVLLPVYNGARHLERAIASVQGQRFGDFELIAVDDGSEDGSVAILERLARDDARIVIIRQPHGGQTAALNRALAAARGRYLARHDADDWSYPERFARQVAYLEEHPHIAVLGTAAEVIDEREQVISRIPAVQGPQAIRRGLVTVRSTLVHGSVMMRREALEAIGGYRQAFRLCQDFDLWLRMSERFVLDNLPQVLFRWRLNPEGAFVKERATQLKYGGVGLAFMHERQRYGADSYTLLEALHGDLEAFAAQYRLRGLLQAIWGKLLLRGAREPAMARAHLWQALRSGSLRPSTMCWFGLSVLRFRWPGKLADETASA